MIQFFRWYIASIDKIVAFFGRIAGYFTFLLVILICIDVIMRYAFGTSKIWIYEIEIYMFSLIFMLGSAYAYQKDRHVRVDLYYSKWSKKRQAWVNIIGILFLLLPWTIIILIISKDYFLNSFSFREASSQPGGLPAYYLLKGLIFVGFFLLFLQAISVLFKNILLVLGKNQQSSVQPENS